MPEFAASSSGFRLGRIIPAGGLGFAIEPLTSMWWVSRPVWFIAVGILTIFLLAVFGRFERPSPDLRPGPPWWRPAIAAGFVCAGLAGLAMVGIADEDGLNGIMLSLPISGLLIGGILKTTRSGARGRVTISS